MTVSYLQFILLWVFWTNFPFPWLHKRNNHIILSPLLLGFLVSLTQWVEKSMKGWGLVSSSPESPETQGIWSATGPLGKNSSSQQGLGYNFLQWNTIFICFNLTICQIASIKIWIQSFICFITASSSPSHFSCTDLYLPTLESQFHGMLQWQLISTKDFITLHLCLLPQNLLEKFQGDWSEFYLVNLHILTSKR